MSFCYFKRIKVEGIKYMKKGGKSCIWNKIFLSVTIFLLLSIINKENNVISENIYYYSLKKAAVAYMTILFN